MMLYLYDDAACIICSTLRVFVDPSNMFTLYVSLHHLSLASTWTNKVVDNALSGKFTHVCTHEPL